MNSDVLYGLINAMNWMNLLAAFLSVSAGVLVGALPGLSAAMGVALLIPVTFGMPADTALIALAGVYCGAIYGGSISAILLHTPGTSSAAATAIDGYQMTLKGQAGKALGTATIASFIGGILSTIALYVLSPPLASLALRFGPAEYFWLSIFGLTIIAGVSSKSILKGLLSGAIGLAVSTIGMDPVLGVPRFTFGVRYLLDGVPFTSALIGLFSMSQVLVMAESKLKVKEKAHEMTDRVMLSMAEIKRILPTCLRSTVIGTVTGILPGAGGTIAAYMGYNEARRFSKNKEEFGHGSIEGIAGAEAANNAVTGGSLIPTLTLGIPGNSVTAILLGGLIIQGMRSGPELFTSHARITYTFFAGFMVVNVFMLLVGLFAGKYFAKVASVYDGILIPIIFGLSVIGSYSIYNRLFDVWVMLIFGIVGYFIKKFDLNAAAIVLALILGPIGEAGLRRALILSRGSYEIFFRSTVSLVLIGMSLLSLFSPLLMEWLSRSRASKPKESS
ncbi:tripartite tricarboxylate transporter permease [Anoxynatronum buryatiense]|uniref:Tricarboxylic transport membrane protein n=1 Tax=Anoxynatronum buryatiense TaxID=489973 RepID=A0AA45WTN0_9CLOT|nr:tripartite tricarboxylate transporter permease [Anoxynatronum buryatiense]SMP44047.1 putative tricarboxylic transport membrane protein [Anoxynatronum buryatiense]